MFASIRAIIKQTKGSVTMLALLGMVTLGILGAGFFSLSSASTKAATSYRDEVAAQYIAEAGAQDVIARIRSGSLALDKTSDPISSPTPLNQGTPTEGNYSSYLAVSTDKNGQSTYQVISKGIVNSSKTARSIALTITPTPKNNNVTGKYIVYAKQDLTITNDSNTFAGRTLTDAHDIGSDGTYYISATKQLLEDIGTAWAKSTSSYPAYNQWYNTQGIAKQWRIANPVGTLTVSTVSIPISKAAIFPTNSGTNLATATNGTNVQMKNFTLSDAFYYCNGNYSLVSSQLTFTAPKVTLLINGDLTLNIQNASTIPAIYGSDLTIYVTGNVTLTNGAYIGAFSAKDKTTLQDIQTALPATSAVRLYSQKAISVGNGGATKIQSGSIAIQSLSDFSMNNTASMTAKDSGTLSIDSVSGAATFTNTSTLNGGTISVAGKTGIELNSYVTFTAPADTGNITLSSSAGKIHLTNYANLLAGSNVLLQSQDITSIDSNTYINNDAKYANAITKIYCLSTSQMSFTNSYRIGGKAVLVAAQGPISLPGTTDQTNTVFMSNSGESSLSNSIIGPFYTNGSLRITPNNQIYYSRKILEALGFTFGNDIIVNKAELH